LRDHGWITAEEAEARMEQKANRISQL
jgi:hypothetical protein